MTTNVICCVCFDTHVPPYDNLYVDSNGDKWDHCKGQCTVDVLGRDSS